MTVTDRVHGRLAVLQSTVQNRLLVLDRVRRYILRLLRDLLAHVRNKDVWIIEDFLSLLFGNFNY